MKEKRVKVSRIKTSSSIIKPARNVLRTSSLTFMIDLTGTE